MKKILIIEDDLFLGDVLNKKLKNEGFEVVLSTDGLDGLNKLKSFHPDLVLLDMILSKMTGIEILEMKQKDALLASIPVIIISNSGQPVEINRALALGVKDYLVKAQFEPEDVMTKIRAQLKKNDSFSSATSLEGAINANTHTVNLEGKKIVWVEDDQFLSDILTRKLITTKCVFSHFTQGEEALKAISQDIPDVVMLDILLSGIDGFEILKRIKGDPKTKNIPVILLSNLGQASDIERGKGLGAVRFLVKATVTPNDILDQIREVVAENQKA